MLTEPLDKFHTSSGIEYQRYADFRDAVKPGWRANIDPDFVVPIYPEKAHALVRHLVRTMNGCGGHIKNVLEIGCHGGRCAFALAEAGALVVDALDIAPLSNLENLRRRTSEHFEETTCEINFHSGDIADWDKEETHHLIVSWQTLEHIIRWGEAIKRTYNALKPGGFCYHRYEPFFSWRGGHSKCTLDFPYGHVLLSANDFNEYILQYRPEEHKQTINAYRYGLNRMTLADLRGCAENVGFEVLNLSIIDFEGGQWATQSVVEECQVNYPSLTRSDLIAHTILVLFRKRS